MTPTFTFVLLAVVAFTIGQVAWRRSANLAILRGAAERLGNTRELGGWRVGIVASIDGVDVQITRGTRHRHNRRDVQVTTYRVEGVPKGVAFRRQGIANDLAQLVVGTDHLTGDDGFDRGVLVGGDPALVTAVLDAPTRQRVWAAVMEGAGSAIADGEVVVRIEEEGTEPGSVAYRAREVAALAVALQVTPREIPTRIAAIVQDDPNAEVRRRAAEVLVSRFRGPVVDGAMRAVRMYADPGLRLVAATHLGDLDALDHLALDGAAPGPIRALAVRHLATAGAGGRLAPALPALLTDPDPAVRHATLRAAPGIDAAAARALLARARFDAPSDRAALADALARLGEGEASLIALTRDPDATVRLAAVRALGEVGSRTAVPALRARLSDALGLGGVSEAARAALARVEARLGPVGAGQLGLAEEAPVGAVSVVEGEGRLSLAPRRGGDG